MTILGARTKYNTRCSRHTKTSSSSAVSVMSQIGVLHSVSHMATLSLNLHLSNTRTHTLLSELKDNGLKGDLIDFVWVYFTYTLGIDLMAN